MPAGNTAADPLTGVTTEAPPLTITKEIPMTIGPPVVGAPTVNSKWQVDVDLSPEYTGTWAQLRGMSDFTPGLDTTIKDATDYDTDGWGNDAATLRKWKNDLTVLRKKYGSSEDFDPAQEALRAAADDLGKLAHVRFYEREAGGEAYEGYALVQWDPQGGPADDLSSVKVTLLGQGKRHSIANPWTGSSGGAPVVASLSPTGGPTAGGNLVAINGAGFTGVTGVKFGTVAATDFTVLSSAQIVATAPAGTAGAKDVTVTTAGGTSNTGVKYTYA